MVDYISVTQDVRELSRSVLASDFPNDEIIKEQKAAYSDISIILHKNDWVSTDAEFPSIQKIEAQLAKAYIQEHYGGPDYYQIIKDTREDAYHKLETIKDNMSTVPTDEEDILTRTEFKSWNKNETIPYESKLSSVLRSDTTGIDD